MGVEVARRPISDKLARELESYRGEWVAIKRGHVVVHSRRASELVNELARKKDRDATIHFVANDPHAVFVL